jgi:rubrerythrin
VKRTDKTVEYLAKAFVGESQARSRYAFYAKAEGYEQISAMFLKTAEQERSHFSSL